MTRDIEVKPSKKPSVGMTFIVYCALIAWCGAVLALMKCEAFDADLPWQTAIEIFGIQVPWQTAIAIVMPIGIYLLAFKCSASFRQWIYACDPLLLSLMQTFRILGVLFLPLYSYGILPGGFAWAAGVGDVLIACLAVFVSYRLAKGTIKLNSTPMWALHILGILDLIMAVSSRVFFHASVMGQSPLVFIPVYLVPLWIILHLAVIAHMTRRKCS